VLRFRIRSQRNRSTMIKCISWHHVVYSQRATLPTADLPSLCLSYYWLPDLTLRHVPDETYAVFAIYVMHLPSYHSSCATGGLLSLLVIRCGLYFKDGAMAESHSAKQAFSRAVIYAGILSPWSIWSSICFLHALILLARSTRSS
jgi:hypothetical protein